jgi:adenine-specific DNA-methyltransferase
MSKHPKLELTWIGKENRPKLEPRILVEDPEKSYHARFRRELTAKTPRAPRQEGENGPLGDLGALAVHCPSPDLFDNRLIFGDNLLALKALEQEFTGKIKCIYIDPPYNTGSAFTHYDDGVEHSIWLSLMRDRLEILRRLLTEDGAIWVTLDDNEAHYCKVLMDELYGRSNFIGNIVWQSKDTPGNNSAGIAQTHNHLLVFRKSEQFKPTLLERNDEQVATYTNPDEDSRGPWLATPLTRVEFRERDYYAIRNKKGREVFPPKGSSWRRPPAKMKELEEQNRIWWGKGGDAEFPMEKKFLTEVKEGVVNQTWWPYEFGGSTRNASAELKGLFGGEKAFDTPKPEKLLYRVLQMSTRPGDWVLDSFAGSGTTGAVAHKMGRRWIMVELGEHCHTHIIPRLKKVIDGEDQGGISKAVNWKGGGGFRYYRLGPSLIVKDEWENPVINPEFNAGMLAEAMCKLEGFTFEPNPDVYWQQGRGSETNFIYVTTQMMTKEMLTKISDEVGPSRSLLICCGAYKADVAQFENLTVKKIPKAVLKKCEWGHDDYSLEIKNLPVKIDSHEGTKDTKGQMLRDFASSCDNPPRKRFGKGKTRDEGPTLFDLGRVK